jgi:hypothetical protein
MALYPALPFWKILAIIFLLTYTDTMCLGLIIYLYTVQCRGQERTLWYPYLYISWHRYLSFVQDSGFSLSKTRANKLDET